MQTEAGVERTGGWNSIRYVAAVRIGIRSAAGIRCGVLIIILFSLALCAATQEVRASGHSGRAEKLLNVPAARPGSEMLRLLAARGTDILAVGGRGATIVAEQSDLDWLETHDHGFTVLREDLSAFRTDMSRTVEDSAFHTYEETLAELQRLAALRPEIAILVDTGDSLEGRDLWALKISDNAAADEVDEPRVLLVGCHHAREWISVEVPLLIGKYLVEQYGTDGYVTGLVNGAEIWVLPMLNPDGHEFSVQEQRLWRKNRRDNGDGTWGVDLNRNYAYAWGYDNSGSSPFSGDGTYRGPAPFSEPESQAIRDLFSNGRPFSATISYHNFSQVILLPWGFIDEPTPDDGYYGRMGQIMAALITSVYGVEYTAGRGADILYPTNGDYDDWVYGNFRIPSFTIELRPEPGSGYDGFVNPPEDIEPTYRENLPAALWLIEQAILGLPLVGDVDTTGRVDGMDLGYFSYAFGTGEGAERWDPYSDLDGNGVVDGADLAILAANFGVIGWGVNPF